MALNILLILFAVLGAAWVLGKKGDGIKLFKANDEFPFHKRSHLCDPNERRFLGALVMAVGNEYLIMTKVRIADLMVLSKQLDEKGKKNAYDKVSREHVDFVLCRKHNTEVVCAIDLIDRTSLNMERARRAKFLDELFKNAGLPFVRFGHKEKYRPMELKTAIELELQRVTKTNIPNIESSRYSVART